MEINTQVSGNSATITLAGEVEHYDQRSDSAPNLWQLQSVVAASGGDAMVKNSELLGAAGINSQPESLTYFLFFDEPGDYRLWVRAKRDSDSILAPATTQLNDGVFATLNDVQFTGAVGISGFGQEFEWLSTDENGSVATVNISSRGFHSLNLWLGDQVTAIDKFVVTNNFTFEPSDTGPAAFDGTDDSPDRGGETETETETDLELESNAGLVTSSESGRSGGSASAFLLLVSLMYLMLPLIRQYRHQSR